MQPDKLLSTTLGLLLAFARQGELSMFRHQRGACRAQCGTCCWSLTASGSRRGGCSAVAPGLLWVFFIWAKLPGSCRLSHPLHGRTYKMSEIIATGNLLHKHHRGKSRSRVPSLYAAKHRQAKLNDREGPCSLLHFSWSFTGPGKQNNAAQVVR